MPEEKPTNIEEEMRKVGISITRSGDTIKLKVGKHKAELFPIEGKTQTYPFFAVAQWMTETAVAMLEPLKQKEVVFSKENRQAAKNSIKLLGLDDSDAVTDNIMRQIHEDNFGSK